jgi:hypothetical protein
VSAKLGLPTSRPAFCFLANLVLAQPKTKPNFFTSPKVFRLVWKEKAEQALFACSDWMRLKKSFAKGIFMGGGL